MLVAKKKNSRKRIQSEPSRTCKDQYLIFNSNILFMKAWDSWLYLLLYCFLLLPLAYKKHKMMEENTSEIIEEEGIKGYYFTVG